MVNAGDGSCGSTTGIIVTTRTLDTTSTLTPYFVTIILPRSSSTYTTTFDLATTPTSSAVPAPKDQSHHGLSGSQIGGVVGGIVGFIAILILLCCCIDFTGSNRRNRQNGKGRNHGTSTYSYPLDHRPPTTTTTPPPPPPGPTTRPPATPGTRNGGPSTGQAPNSRTPRRAEPDSPNAGPPIIENIPPTTQPPGNHPPQGRRGRLPAMGRDWRLGAGVRRVLNYVAGIPAGRNTTIDVSRRTVEVSNTGRSQARARSEVRPRTEERSWEYVRHRSPSGRQTRSAPTSPTRASSPARSRHDTRMRRPRRAERRGQASSSGGSSTESATQSRLEATHEHNASRRDDPSVPPPVPSYNERLRNTQQNAGRRGRVNFAAGNATHVA